MKSAADNGLLLDFTAALPTKGLILTDTGVMLRIPLRPMDIARILDTLDKPTT